MDSNYDVFAGLTDFCDNFAVDKIQAPKGAEVSADLSGSDVEDSFLTAMKTSGKKSTNRKNIPTTSSKDPKKSPPKQPTPKRGTRKKAGAQEDNVPEPPTVSGRTRSRGRRGRQVDIENYMLQQTLQMLQAQQEQIVHPSRARRNHMAELASNAPVVGTVDLAGPKTPPLPPWSTPRSAVICLGSDDENDDLEMSIVACNSSFDIENAEICVKVKWGDKIDVVPHRKHQKFSDLMKMFANREGVATEDILLNLDNRIIEPDDTPDSIDYKIVQFLSGRIIQNRENPVKSKVKDPNSVKLKIQSDAFKRPLIVLIKKDQQFKILYIKCSEELHIPCDQIKLSFDGEPLILTETPNDLDLEGGEVIDCRIKK